MSLSLSNPVVITKAQASIDEFGSDYTSGSTEELLMYEVTWIPPYTGVYVYEGEDWEYISIQFEFQVFGGATETLTMPGVPALTTSGDVLWHPESSMELEPQQSAFNPQTESEISPGLTVARWVAVSGTALTNANIPSYLLGRFYLQVAPGNEGTDITVSLVDTLTTQYNKTQGENYTVQSGSFPSSVYTIPASDSRAYVINPTITATPISGSVYEAVSDTQEWTTGNFYLLELATGKLYTSDQLGSTTAQYFNCGYGCSYISSAVWTVGSEVVGLDRPDSLWAPQSTVSSAVWTLT